MIFLPWGNRNNREETRKRVLSRNAGGKSVREKNQTIDSICSHLRTGCKYTDAVARTEEMAEKGGPEAEQEVLTEGSIVERQKKKNTVERDSGKKRERRKK